MDGVEIAAFEDGYARTVVFRDGDVLRFVEDFDDGGRILTSERTVAVADFLARGEGPYPWFDLGTRRAGALGVLDAIDGGRPPWTVPLETAALQFFEAADRGSDAVGTSLAQGVAVDTPDPCGATAFWWAACALQPDAGLILARAGADAGRRIERDAHGARWTTVLHELVRGGRAATVAIALEHGAVPDAPDADGHPPLAVIEADHVGAELVGLLVGAGADVDQGRPLDLAARRMLPATVAALLDRGATPGDAIGVLLGWYAVMAQYHRHRVADVVAVLELLRAGGAEVTDRHRELAAQCGDDRVERAVA